MKASRQAWLRDPERPRSFSVVDPRPVEAAILDEPDTMRDMVREYVEGIRRREEDNAAADDDFLADDALLSDDALMSPYEEEHPNLFPYGPPPPPSPVLAETGEDPSADGAEKGAGDAPNSDDSTQA